MALKIRKKKSRTGRGPAAEVGFEHGKVAHATDDTFRALVLEAPEPVLVDFWAEWCGPCKKIGPVVESLAGDYAGRARIVKVNTDHCKLTAGRYQISSIPTLAIFKGGKPVETMVGVQSKKALSQVLDRVLA